MGVRLWCGRVSALASKDRRTGQEHHRHHSNGYFSFGFGGPGYYYAPPPRYYYAPPPAYYYPPPPPAYYYPPPAYYGPGASFNLVVPFGHHR